MRAENLSDLTVEQLVELFSTICVEQNRALLGSEIRKFNRLFDRMVAVKTELKDRPGDERRALMKLFDHPDLQVKLQAAKAICAVDLQAGRQMLQAIESWRRQPQAGDAGMSLLRMDRGEYVPK